MQPFCYRAGRVPWPHYASSFYLSLPQLKGACDDNHRFSTDLDAGFEEFSMSGSSLSNGASYMEPLYSFLLGEFFKGNAFSS
jgi:hypothetical protein